MLTHPLATPASVFDELREREFARLDEAGVSYLDYAGSALYAASHVSAHHAYLRRTVLGNPHAEHGSSLTSARAIETARRLVLDFLDAGDDYTVCFTANASAAIKLVAEAYPFGPDAACVLTADNHNSVNGIREYARRAGAPVGYLPLRRDLRLDHPEARLAETGGPGLFAFPAQSNFSGVQHPLSLAGRAQALGYHVLLDAAAFVPTHRLSLRACPADFVALSFYKVFGYPGGVGALVARREAIETLARPWFAGGTVDFASVQLRRHRLRALEAGFEDGTANFLDIPALEPGFALMQSIGLDRLRAHVMGLTAALVQGLSGLRHRNGGVAVRMYGEGGPEPFGGRGHGGTVAFNVLDDNGSTVPYGLVEDRANAAGVHLRGGCFCNPGAAEAAFQFDAGRMDRCLDALADAFTPGRLQACMGRDVAVGAVRASLGAANNAADVGRAVEVVASFLS